MKTVCIVGMAPTSRDLVPEEPADGREFWGLNQGHNYYPPQILKRFTRWFQVHPWEEMVPRQTPENHHLEWLANCGIPVYLEEVNPQVPTGVRYPYEDVVSYFGGAYLTSALAFMLALAVYERFEEIRVFGVDMATNTEYEDQRPCFEFLLGFAIAQGTRVWLPPGSPLLKGPLYAKTVHVTTSTIERRMREWVTQRDKMLAKYNMMSGRVEAARELGHPDVALRWEGDMDLVQAQYNALQGRVDAADELLFLALKGDGGRAGEPPGFLFDQNHDGHIQLRERDSVWSIDHKLLGGSAAVLPKTAVSEENLAHSLPPSLDQRREG